MRILHYALGFPPYRTGGLTKFCMDIMQQQKNLGHEVALMWPGQMKMVNKSVKVKGRKESNGIQSFEVINPLPISYDEGITEIDAFTEPCNRDAFMNILKKLKPDVVHVHTLMGLHKEFMEAAKELRIKTVFTIHDLFTICPKVTMFRDGKVCEHVSDCSLCPQCNLTALSMKKIFILQLPQYRALKDSSIVKKLRKSHRDQYLNGDASVVAEAETPNTIPADYQHLREYYGEMIALFDTVHANSTVTRDVFVNHCKPYDLKVIPISHADIKDNRRKKEFFPDRLRLTYLGPAGEAKGFFSLKAALDELWLKDTSFSLNVFFTPTEVSPYMKVHGRYNYSELEEIFQETDALIAPSILNETFGYTALEALSYGVPVVVSDQVGAKDVIPDGCGVVVKDMEVKKLKEVIQGLTVEKLTSMNQNIIDKASIMTLEKMTDEIMEQCY